MLIAHRADIACMFALRHFFILFPFISGKTIESALPIMSRNRSGVIVQGAANKADLNFKYEKLQLILIDEIR